MKTILLYFLLGGATLFFGLRLFQWYLHHSDENSAISSWKIEHAIIDAGNVQQGMPVKANFIIRNLGREKLYIGKISPDCHCTSFSVNKEYVLPDDSATIGLIYDALNPGIFQASALVEITGNKYGQELLVFRGNVVVDDKKSAQ